MMVLRTLRIDRFDGEWSQLPFGGKLDSECIQAEIVSG